MAFTPAIDIIVNTEFLPEQSQQSQQRFAFAYTITITNNSTKPVTLLNRHWQIIDANNHKQEVSGEGVIGQQPRLLPEQSFQYSSGAILKTSAGTMEGHYEFESDDKELFKAPIPLFTLVDPKNLH